MGEEEGQEREARIATEMNGRWEERLSRMGDEGNKGRRERRDGGDDERGRR